jgi:MFS family permease
VIVWRIVQGVGGACLLANAAAIITDAFPSDQRGMALGINNIVGVSGMFVGLVLGGILAPIDWRLVFLISVPVGLFGTVWAYLKLREISTRTGRAWTGGATSASARAGSPPAGCSARHWPSVRSRCSRPTSPTRCSRRSSRCSASAWGCSRRPTARRS